MRASILLKLVDCRESIVCPHIANVGFALRFVYSSRERPAAIGAAGRQRQQQSPLTLLLQQRTNSKLLCRLLHYQTPIGMDGTTTYWNYNGPLRAPGSVWLCFLIKEQRGPKHTLGGTPTTSSSSSSSSASRSNN